MSIRLKKYLGQHFLKDEYIAKKITDILSEVDYDRVLEVGPGSGMMTKYLLKKKYLTYVMEVDGDFIPILEKKFPDLKSRIYHQDFLQSDLIGIFKKSEFAIIGNFPYNISTQIIFKVLLHKNQIVALVGMFQKEVAQRICAVPGNKIYGMMSVLTQMYYETEYLFTVPASVFHPPPKVESGLIFMKRKENLNIAVDRALFERVVKTSFRQRRKTLRNNLKILNLPDCLTTNPIFDKRPEQISVEGYISLTLSIEKNGVSD